MKDYPFCLKKREDQCKDGGVETGKRDRAGGRKREKNENISPISKAGAKYKVIFIKEAKPGPF